MCYLCRAPSRTRHGASPHKSSSHPFECVATNNGLVTMNMPGTSSLTTFTNNGVFLLSGTGTGSASWNGGAVGNSYAFINAGNIDLRSGGTFTINTLDATTTGFSNTTAGLVVITNGATFKVGRSTSGWGGDTPVNMGTMVMSNGTFQTSDGAAGTTLDQSRLFKNAGTIVVQGRANLTNLWQSTLLNAGSLVITNDNTVLQLGTASTVNWFTNAATGTIILATNGTVASLVATNGPSPNQFSNLGTIKGQ